MHEINGHPVGSPSEREGAATERITPPGSPRRQARRVPYGDGRGVRRTTASARSRIGRRESRRVERAACFQRWPAVPSAAHRLQDGPPKSTSSVATVPAVRPGAVSEVQYRFVCAITCSGGGAPQAV
jgi:hypothetical protein